MIFVLFLGFLLPYSSSLYLGSFNIRAGDNFTGDYDLKNQAKLIDASEFVLVGLQEVDMNTERHPVNEPKLLTEYTNLKHVKFTSFRRFEGGHYGIAILSKYPFFKEKVYRYKGKSEDECEEYETGDICQGANAVLLDLDFGDESEKMRIWFVNTHLGLTIMEEEAKLLVDWIEKELINDGFPIFVSGDFNSEPDSETHKVMLDVFEDSWDICEHGKEENGFTFPSDEPTERIDYLYSFSPKDNDLGCTWIDVIDSEVSDHRALRVKFENTM